MSQVYYRWSNKCICRNACLTCKKVMENYTNSLYFYGRRFHCNITWRLNDILKRVKFVHCKNFADDVCVWWDPVQGRCFQWCSTVRKYGVKRMQFRSWRRFSYWVCKWWLLAVTAINTLLKNESNYFTWKFLFSFGGCCSSYSSLRKFWSIISCSIQTYLISGWKIFIFLATHFYTFVKFDTVFYQMLTCITAIWVYHTQADMSFCLTSIS